MADIEWPRARSPAARYPCCHDSRFEERKTATPASIAKHGWPRGVREIWYDSPTGLTRRQLGYPRQPALFYEAPGSRDEPRPLLVAFHPWSATHIDGAYGESSAAHFCVRQRWHFLHPNFLGTNCRPEACGSDWVVTSIADGVAYAQTLVNVDPTRIYAIGGCARENHKQTASHLLSSCPRPTLCVRRSGGGMAALLMAGRAPHLFRGGGW